MQYSIGESTANFGFGFYEKLHEPIFLVHKLGRIIKINESGRKLLQVGHLAATDLETNLCTQFLRKIEGSKSRLSSE